MQGVAPQNRHVISLTQAFLDVHWDRGRPLLLGYSGGPDSKALLYALLACGVKPHIAHVDHGWREESREEAKALQEEAEQLGCPFYSTRLEGEKSEDAARRARFAFFQSLPGYQALLLAHQADDLAETVLKRILEGAHLPFLGGMEPVSQQYGMAIWRPFLSLSRAEVIAFLKDRSLSFFTDKTNVDPAYLRARMRLHIFPFLNELFGKETTENLALLARRAAELRTYLDRQIAKTPLYRGPWGVLVDMEGLERIEQRHLLQKIAREEGMTLSRETLETLLDWLKKGGCSKCLEVRKRKISVEGAKLFFFSGASKDLNSTDCG